MNKIILLCNSKGGVGKSTTAVNLASWLASKGETVTIVDADIQQTIVNQRVREQKQYPKWKIPYDVYGLDSSTPEEVQKQLETIKKLEGIVIVDMPGNLSDDSMIPLYKAADLLIVVIGYDYYTLDATRIFVDTVRVFTKAQMIFIPNRIDIRIGTAGERGYRDQAYEKLRGYGYITWHIKYSVAAMRCSTILPFSKSQEEEMHSAFWKVYQFIDKSNH